MWKEITGGSSGGEELAPAVVGGAAAEMTLEDFLAREKEDAAVREIGRASCRERVCQYV